MSPFPIDRGKPDASTCIACRFARNLCAEAHITVQDGMFLILIKFSSVNQKSPVSPEISELCYYQSSGRGPKKTGHFFDLNPGTPSANHSCKAVSRDSGSVLDTNEPHGRLAAARFDFLINILSAT